MDVKSMIATLIGLIILMVIGIVFILLGFEILKKVLDLFFSIFRVIPIKFR